LIESLQQEVTTLKREKRFIKEKLEKMRTCDELTETNRLLEMEKSKAEVAEKARA
jgi:hypothetical protein